MSLLTDTSTVVLSNSRARQNGTGAWLAGVRGRGHRVGALLDYARLMRVQCLMSQARGRRKRRERSTACR